MMDPRAVFLPYLFNIFPNVLLVSEAIVGSLQKLPSLGKLTLYVVGALQSSLTQGQCWGFESRNGNCMNSRPFLRLCAQRQAEGHFLPLSPYYSPPQPRRPVLHLQSREMTD